MYRSICTSLAIFFIAVVLPGSNAKYHSAVENFDASNGTPRSLSPSAPLRNFYIGSKPLSYHDAKKYCESAGWKLLSIPDVGAQFDLLNFGRYYQINGYAYWTDGNKLESEKWRWGLKGPEFSYINWAPGEPNNKYGKKFCVNIKHDIMAWNDEVCGNEHYFICETN